MSILAQASLFSWKEVEGSSDLLRLRRVLKVLPDEALMVALEAERRGRRDDYPLRAVWNSLLAGVVFGHPSVASLRRELLRNGELRDLCGFDPLRAETSVPPEWVYSRFLVRLMRQRALIETMFESLVRRVGELLPDFGVDLALDGKAITTYGNKDVEASLGYKNYEGEAQDGTPYQQIQKWFGYKLHLLIDANYELPVAFELTSASVGESPMLMPLIERLSERQRHIYERIERLSADRGYDDGQDKAELYDEHGIIPVIPARDVHQGRMQALDQQHHDTIYYSPTGEVCCRVAPLEPNDEKAYAAMQFMGYEAERKSLKFRCPAAAYGLTCRNREACHCAPQVRDGAYGRVVRVPLQRDRRLFTPLYLHGQNFERAYNKRTAVERVNSRLDQVYGFERHFIRTLPKMRLRLNLAMIIMLATAVAWIEAKQPERMRSLVRVA